MNNTYKYFWISCVLLCAFNACDKEDVKTNCADSIQLIENQENVNAPNQFNNGYILINEGGFTYGNASVSYVDEQLQVTNDIFHTVNDVALGDVCQSVSFHNNEAFIVVNNSQKIEIVNQQTFVKKRTLTGFTSPRFALAKGDSAIIVTDFLANEIQQINHFTGCIEKSLPVLGWTEQIEAFQNQYFVLERTPTGSANEFANLLIINQDMTLNERVSIPLETNSFVISANGIIWLLSQGSEPNGVLPVLTKMQANTGDVLQSFTFSDWVNPPLNLGLDSETNTLYFSRGSDIYQMNEQATSLPTSPFFQTAAQNIYRITIDGGAQRIFVSDAGNFVSNGSVSIYNTAGVFIAESQVGVIPSIMAKMP